MVDALLACLRYWAPLRREIPAGGKKRDLSLRWPLQERQQITLRTFQLGRRATERVSGDSLEQLTQMNRIPESGNRIYSQLSILRNSSYDRPLLDRMWEDVRVQMVHHVPAWQRLVLRDDTATDEYYQFMQRRMSLLMWSWIDIGMHPRVDDSSRAAGPVEVGMLWLDHFDTLPNASRPWGVLNSMMRDATMLLGPDGPELFDPLFQRLADHPSPMVQLYGARGRLMGEFTFHTPEADINVPRVEEVRKQALVVLDDALEAGDLKVKSVVVDFLRRTYEGIVFQAKPQMVQEFVAACDALLDRGINPPAPMIEGLSGADGQFVEEEIRVLERVISMFPTSKFQRRLDAVRERYQEKSSAADPEENGE